MELEENEVAVLIKALKELRVALSVSEVTSQQPQLPSPVSGG